MPASSLLALPQRSNLMAATELPVAVPAPPLAPRSDEWLWLASRAKLLSWLSLAWLAVEGTVAIVAGVMAGSVALR
jgi:hypothetical protein